MNNDFLIAGTNEKMQSCRNRLKMLGYNAECFTSADSISSADNIILPLPSLTDGKISGTEITPESLACALNENQTVFYGNMNNIFPCKAYCYSDREDFLKLNSHLTAQGVLRIIPENIKTDLFDLRAAVTGFGHCGSEICRLLKNAGCDVTSFSRRAETRAQAKGEGFKAESFEKSFEDFDIIVNTVPCNIFPEEAIKQFKSECIYIEVASAPYGIKPSTAERLNVRYILAKGLPGRFAPVSSGINIADTAVRILKEVNYE